MIRSASLAHAVAAFPKRLAGWAAFAKGADMRC